MCTDKLPKSTERNPNDQISQLGDFISNFTYQRALLFLLRSHLREEFRNGFLHELDGRDNVLHGAVSHRVFHRFGYDGRRLQNRELHVCVPRRLQQTARCFGQSSPAVRPPRTNSPTGPVGSSNGQGIASLRWFRPQ